MIDDRPRYLRRDIKRAIGDACPYKTDVRRQISDIRPRCLRRNIKRVIRESPLQIPIELTAHCRGWRPRHPVFVPHQIKQRAATDNSVAANVYYFFAPLAYKVLLPAEPLAILVTFVLYLESLYQPLNVYPFLVGFLRAIVAVVTL